jgi:hypothetical protein
LVAATNGRQVAINPATAMRLVVPPVAPCRLGRRFAGTFLLLAVASSPASAFEKSQRVEYENFREPPREYRQQAWLGFNLTRATEETMTAQVAQWAERDLTGGFYLGMSGGSTKGLSAEYLQGAGRAPNEQGIAFLSDEYFDLYAKILEAGLKHGNAPVVFYDEWGYPSGIAGGLFYSKYPQLAAKSLEKVERDASGPAPVQLDIPEGITLGAVRMNLDTRELVDISASIANGRRLACEVPSGRWKVMAFYLDPKASLGQGNKSGYVDYLDPEAVRAYIALCYQPHYDHLKKYFGTVLKITQYDEPALHMANGKTWTPRFNEYFARAHGYDPMKFYPALWYDIGPDTAAVRNALWGFRARLYAESYVKQVDDWCREHGLMFSGHMDQEEISNPVPVNGDFMKVFEHQAVPGIDDIWWWGRTNRGYKLVSSAAYNWDKPAVLAETYAAYRENMKPEIVYQVAMDQAAMGTNFQVGALPRDKTPASDRFIGRVSYLLQHGRHVADIAILYPIASLQAEFRFGNWTGPGASASSIAWSREGGITPRSDYIELGEAIFRGLRRDFTFLHPDVLADRCTLEGRQLVLNNAINRERYDVLVVPAADVVSVATARKLREFWAAGGTVIATGVLPEKSAELGRDREVQELVGEVFGLPKDGLMTAKFDRRLDDFLVLFEHESPAGGRAYFVPKWKDTLLASLLARATAAPDVTIQLPPAAVHLGRDYAGSLTYLHKVKDGRDIYFFANSSAQPVDTQVVLRGRKKLAVWDPHTGERRPLETTVGESGGQPTTTAPLVLAPIHAVFFVQEP